MAGGVLGGRTCWCIQRALVPRCGEEDGGVGGGGGGWILGEVGMTGGLGRKEGGLGSRCGGDGGGWGVHAQEPGPR